MRFIFIIAYALRLVTPWTCNKWLNDCWHQKDGKLFILSPVAFHQIRRKFEAMSNLQGYLLRGVGMLSDWNFNGRIIPSSHNCWLREFSWNGEGSIKLLPQGNILAVETFGAKSFFQFYEYACLNAGLHKLWYPSIRDTSTWSKFGAHENMEMFSCSPT